MTNQIPTAALVAVGVLLEAGTMKVFPLFFTLICWEECWEGSF